MIMALELIFSKNNIPIVFIQLYFRFANWAEGRERTIFGYGMRIWPGSGNGDFRQFG